MKGKIVRRVAAVGFAIVAAMLCASDSRATVASEKAKDEECRRYVQDFYDWYAKADFDESGMSESLDDVLDQNLLSRDLADQLNDVLDSQDDYDAIWLDFDPILNSRHEQDSHSAGSVTHKGEHYLVEVYGVSHGRKFGRPDVVAELVYQIGGWTFVNFHYPNHAGTPAKENLLSVLKEIRRSHPVKHHVQPSDEPQA
jgi:hypothetical protein